MKKSNLITVSAAVLLLSLQSAAAQVCTTPPTCDALGYNKTASECSGMTMLKCPLDQSKVYCPSADEISSSKTYKVGDIYVDANGTGIGTVVKVDKGGQHGIVVSGSAYAGTESEVNQYCMSKTSGGLEWGLITYATANLYGDLNSGCEYFLTASGCCYICSSSVSGDCHSSGDFGYSNCSGGLCQASF